MNFRSASPLVLTGPIIVFGGPYSNLHALDALLAEAQRLGVAPSAMISTGDLVAYCADARGVVDRFRETGMRFIRGNCEDQIAAGAADCGCGFAPGGECDRLSSDWFAHALRELDDGRRAFLGAAPERLDIALNGLRIAVIHGAATQQNRFVFASTPARVKAHDLDLLGVDAIFAGHSGLPFSQSIDGRLWHNAGALGMPANEGDPRVWFSLVSAGEAPGTLVVEHRALAYDHAGAAAAMTRAGLAAEYARTLVDGLWPNCDALAGPEAAAQGRRLAPARLLFSRDGACDWPKPEPARPEASGGPPARVELAALETLWINTGSRCNLACAACFMESTPRNDALAYMSARDVSNFLDEIAREKLGARTIGFTGGEPFLNRDLPKMLEDVLARGHEALALTNAMKPMRRREAALRALRETYGARLALRVSLDHYSRDLHELERGPDSFAPTLDGLAWLARENFAVSVAGRLYSGEPEAIVRAGYARLFAECGLALDAHDPAALLLFPEMGAAATPVRITDATLENMGKSRNDLMCAGARMAIRRKGADAPVIVACTLLPYDSAFEMGETLAAARGPVELTHAHCATFCVFGGASCA
ncbi:MAG TPA: radical SAM protein [Rhodoblastus sp.]|nr:radical SAM protein [Rhodoblastus sp.]